MRVHADWLLTPQRAAVHLPTATAVVADLHLDYDRARRRGGEAVPHVDLEEALAPLREVAVAHAVRRLVIAGDLFEQAWCDATVVALCRVLGSAGMARVELVPGNHDRGLPEVGGPLAIHREGLALDGWQVVHGDGLVPADRRVVCGHFHPWFRWGPVAAACYLVTAERLILPAFSRDAAGVNVLAGRRWQGHRCCVIAGAAVLDFGDIAALQRRRGGIPRPAHGSGSQA